MKKIDNWKVARFSNKTKQLILERDEYKCIICWSTDMLNIHHVYFWQESNRTSTRNNIDQWVTICQSKCHIDCHWCRRLEWIRQRCIDYINNYYKNDK